VILSPIPNAASIYGQFTVLILYKVTLRAYCIEDGGNSVSFHSWYGPCSSVGIATSYGLDGPGIESRWGARFSALVQTGPGAHPASCTMGTGSFPGVKSGQGVTLTPHPLLVLWS
jgi:hypothetical protein